jgi:hypothetical protein
MSKTEIDVNVRVNVVFAEYSAPEQEDCEWVKFKEVVPIYPAVLNLLDISEDFY